MLSFNKASDYAESIKWRVRILNHKGHIWVKIKGPNFVKSALTSIGENRTSFERKVIMNYLVKLARDANNRGERPKSLELRYINYAEIFGSRFD